MKKVLLLLLLLLFIFSCKDKNSPPLAPKDKDSSPLATYEYTYRIPEQTYDGWQTTSLSNVGMDEGPIEDLVGRIRNNIYQEVHSVVIVKDYKLVFEEYFLGPDFSVLGENYHGALINFSRNTRHNTHSATKSIVSVLIGIAIDKEFIPNENERVLNYFPGYSDLFDEQKEKMTIEHFLTMTSGLMWNEWDVVVSAAQDVWRFNESSDPIRYLLSKPIVTEPGTSFYYNGGGVDLLGEIVTRATETRVDQFAGQYLLGPIGINSYQFQRSRSGLVLVHGDIYLRPRDMAKFGYLFLNNGVWNGNRVLSEAWVQKSTEEYISLPFLSWADAYGYLWWMKIYNHNNQAIESIKAIGWGGQEIIIFRDLNMVIVFTGANYVSDPPCDEIVLQFILPAVL